MANPDQRTSKLIGVLLFSLCFCSHRLYRAVAEERKAVFVLSQKTAKLFFMLAKSFLAIFTSKTRIRFFGKTLGIQAEGDLPTKQEQERNAQQRPRDEMRHHQKRCEHHRIIPVIDAAARAAFIAQKPRLKGTEKEDADHIANRICKRDKQHDAVIKNIQIIKRKKDTVERKPRRSGNKGAPPSGKLGNFFLCGCEILLELLLASHAFQFRGEKPKDHLHGKDHENRAEKPRIFNQMIKMLSTARQSVVYVKPRRQEKERRTEAKLPKMHFRDAGKFVFLFYHNHTPRS